VGELT